MTLSASISVAVVQMSSRDDVAYNLAEARRHVETAAARGARLVCLPEYFCFIGRDEMARVALAEAPGEGPIQSALAALARDTGVWLLGGTVPLRAGFPRHASNSSLLFDPEGAIAARYDKLHLFRFQDGGETHDEADTMTPGDRIVSAEGPFGCLRLSVCYDLRFPELYRAAPAADLIAVPAAFTRTTGLAHWELLLRARAVENQAFVLAPGQCGTHVNGWHTFGHSMIVGPWGEVLARLDDTPGVALATLDAELLCATRARLPALMHRRIEGGLSVRPFSTGPDVAGLLA
jgi:deaminated glutathione amidase